MSNNERDPIEIEVPLGIIKGKIGISTLINRAVKFWRKDVLNIAILGDTNTGKTWFVHAARLASQDELDNKGITIGSQQSDLNIPLGTQFVKFRVLDIGGHEESWYKETLIASPQIDAILLFIHFEPEYLDSTKLFIKNFASFLADEKVSPLKKNVRLLIPIVSKSDVWIRETSEREMINKLQRCYKEEYELIRKNLGRRKCYNEYVTCSSRNRNGIRKIFNIIYNS
jgi:GTPase SAR1 family protein